MDRGTQAAVTAACFTGLAFLFVLIRCIGRFCVIKQAGFEDYLIIFALLLSAGLTAMVELKRQAGMGQHAADVPIENNVTLSKLLYASIIVYNLGLSIVKNSILYQYLRIFVERHFRRISWAFIILISVVGPMFILVHCFSCRPIQAFWDHSIPGAKCINFMPFVFSLAAFNILTDFIVWILPMPVLKKLQMPRKQKISLISVFALGGFGCIMGILRLHALYVASVSTDLTYDNVGAATWSAAELNVGIMCASIPAMRPVIALIFPRLLSSTRRGSTSDPYPRGASYFRNESVVELSHVPKNHTSGTSNDDNISFEGAQAPGTIRVEQEWTITANERP